MIATLLLALAIGLPFAAGAAVTVSAGAGRRRPSTAGRRRAASGVAGTTVAVAAAWVSALAAAGLVVWTARSGDAVEVLVASQNGSVLAGVSVDRLGAVLLLVVCGVSAVVQAFARRYLLGEPEAARFFALGAVLTGATAGVVTSVTLAGLAVMWSLAGLALLGLIGLRRPHADVADVADALRRARRTLVIGDAALWAAVVGVLAAVGDLDLRNPGAGDVTRLDGASGAAIACLLVVAAAVRCAQWPAHRWLPASLAAPTPVSALLHAGVVNAGGILLIRLHPVFGDTPAATWAIVAIGSVSAVIGTAVSLARPDVKGALASSTTAQMGFMLVACGVGLLGAAVFHLVAHAMYKAALFLGSGSALQEHVRRRQLPLPTAGRARATAAALLAAAAVATAVAAAVTGGAGAPMAQDGTSAANAAVLLFVLLTALSAGHGWLRVQTTPTRLAAMLIGVALVVAAHAIAFAAMSRHLAPDLPDAGPGSAPGWTLAPLLISLVGLVALSRSPLATSGRAWASLRARCHAWALSAGQQPHSAPGRLDLTRLPSAFHHVPPPVPRGAHP